MPGVRDLLDRFRPAGAPGPAGIAGVPADRQDSVAAELKPVFAALAEVEEECERLRRDAARAAARHADAADAQAHALVAGARNGAGAERAAAAARVREDAAAEVAHLEASAAGEADEIRRRNAHRRPWLLSQVIERVRADLAALDGGGPGPPDMDPAGGPGAAGDVR